MNFEFVEKEVIFKKRPLNEDGRELIIMEIMGHQEKLRKDAPRVSIIQLTQLSDKELVFMWKDALTLQAITHFYNCGVDPSKAKSVGF